MTAEEQDAARAARLLEASPEWVRDCMRWRGEILTGDHAHWCEDWDGLPVDETCDEWPCGCIFQPIPVAATCMTGMLVIFVVVAVRDRDFVFLAVSAVTSLFWAHLSYKAWLRVWLDVRRRV